MVRKVISYFNKELKFYESIKIVENQSDNDIIGSCRRYIQMCPLDQATPLCGREIRIIGEYHDEDMNEPLVSYKDPVLVVDCDEILKVRFPSIYEQGSTNN